MPTAFYSGLNYTGSQTTRYNNILMQKFPDYIYFQRWRADFIYLRFDEELKEDYLIQIQLFSIVLMKKILMSLKKEL
ncbi:MAG: hypothetical protein IPL16_13175 [Ignavibacteria bacterium]|nr:hypothetical protein [Ignavibacteria bacterium]